MNKISQSQQPLFALTPNMSVAMIPIIVSSLITSIILGIVLGILINPFVGIITGFLLFLGKIFFRYMNLKDRKYLFFKEKIEFYDGFLNIVQKTVQYQKITDCILIKTVWDRMFGTGTISLLTAGHAFGGITLQFIEHPNQVYQQIQGLINK